MQTLSVEPKGIASALEALRREASETVAQGTPQIRATVANMVLLAGEDMTEVELGNLVSELTPQYPSRFFIVSIDDAAGSIDVNVRSRAIENHSGKTIHTEEVYISVEPHNVSVVGNLLLSQFVPDIDIILAEVGSVRRDTFQTALLDQLIALSDIYLSDFPIVSDGSDDDTPRTHCHVKNLLWSHVQKWKNLITAQFDSTFAQSQLSKLREASIVSSGSSLKEISSESILLMSWFLEGLGAGHSYDVSQDGDVLRLSVALPVVQGLRKECATFNASFSVSGENSQKIQHFTCGDGDQGEYSIDCVLQAASSMLQVTVKGGEVGEGDKAVCNFSTRKISFSEPTQAEVIIRAITAPERTHVSHAFQVLEKKIRSVLE